MYSVIALAMINSPAQDSNISFLYDYVPLIKSHPEYCKQNNESIQ